MAEQLDVSVDYLLGLTDDPQIHVREPSLDDNERTMLEVYRLEGWSGVIQFAAERLPR